MPRIYVGTYAKYNNGSIEGGWLDLDDYSDKDEFMEAAAALHDDEEDPELMFQDWEEIPDGFISESHIDEGFWEYMNFEDYNDGKAKEAYVECFGEWDEDDFQDRYAGEYRSLQDLAEQLVDDLGYLDQMPEHLRYYFDYEKFANDLRCGGEYTNHGDFWFRNC